MAQRIVAMPKAARLVKSMRDFGYTVPAAIADLVDNSIGAGATQVEVDFKFHGAESFIRIADDGPGIDREELVAALTFGTERGYDEDDLGRYGLGLKTASLSMGRSLTVASRVDGKKTAICRWDLDHLESVKDWELLKLKVSEAPTALIAPLRGRPGTVVMIERLDRILSNYSNPESGHAQRGLNSLAAESKKHLSVVFHRFLAGQVPGRGKVTVKVNGSEVTPWDPFLSHDERVVRYTPETAHFEGMTGTYSVTMSPYRLPQFYETKEAERLAHGPFGWAAHDGFYVYRNHRLIQFGTWLRLRHFGSEPLLQIGRVALDVTGAADAAFNPQVSKQGILLPPDVRDWLEPKMRVLRADLKRYYRERKQRRGQVERQSSGRTDGESSFSQAPPSIRAEALSWVGNRVDGLVRAALQSEGIVDDAALGRISQVVRGCVPTLLQMWEHETGAQFLTEGTEGETER